MNFRFLLLLFCISALSVKAQIFRGTVINEQGKPISYASLYIREIHLGVMTDENGAFYVSLFPGNYTCDTSCFGYENNCYKFIQTNTTLTRNIILMKREYVLPIVENEKDDEKFAFEIVKSTIDAASYYRYTIRSYSADIYSKNRERLVRVPGLQQISKSIRYLAKQYQNKLIVTEKEEELSFRFPCKYKIRILAQTNILPDEINTDINLHTINIYDRMIFNKLSPIAPEALHYYHYILICTTWENGHKIYKIQVVPRHFESLLVSGFIYIVDKIWCITAYDLLIYNSHITANIKMDCKEVEPTIYMPVSIRSTLNYHNIGFQAISTTIHSIRYKNIHIDKGGQTSVKKEFYQQGKHRFERLTPKDMVTINNDSVLLSTDSTFWNRIRTVPLLSDEQKSYQNIQFRREDKNFHFHIKDWTDLRTWWNLIVKGDRFSSLNDERWLKCYNISYVIPEFNFVDGFWIGYRLGIGSKLSRINDLEFTPAVYYTTARHKWIGYGDISFTYAPRRQGKFSLEGGSLTADYNEETGESRMFNSVSSLIYADNYIKLYNKQYITLKNRIEPLDGFLFSSSLSWERRRMVENYLDHSILGLAAEINHPLQDASFTMRPNRLLKTSFLLEYTPDHYYKMAGNKKVYEETINPTISFGYSQAFSLGNVVSSPHYSEVQMKIFQNIKVGLFNHFIWNAEAGCFFHKKTMEFPDYHHFPTVENTSSTRPFSYGFFLLDCYTYSTNKRWMMINTTWNTPYLLIKYLPSFKQKKFDESIHARILATPNEHPYVEIGYSAGVEDISRVGVFAGFDRRGYHSIGISLSFAM